MSLQIVKNCTGCGKTFVGRASRHHSRQCEGNGWIVLHQFVHGGLMVVWEEEEVGKPKWMRLVHCGYCRKTWVETYARACLCGRVVSDMWATRIPFGTLVEWQENEVD